MASNQEIKKYWENRSSEAGTATSATTQDIYLRELEITTLRQSLLELNLPENSMVADIGCGDGYSTSCLAKSFKTLCFRGIDFSSNMIDVAKGRLKENTELKGRISFDVGDATDLRSTFDESSIDVAITDRCLINLTSPEQQYKSFSEIYHLLKPNGHYIGIENFQEGNDNLNTIRESMGLESIPVRWHNLFFKQSDFISNMKNLFGQVEIVDFSSSYYFATRVVYSKYCQMKNINPDYNHEIHQLSVNLPTFGDVSPIKLIKIKKTK